MTLLSLFEIQVDRLKRTLRAPYHPVGRSAPSRPSVTTRRRVQRTAEYARRAEMRRSLKWFREREGV